LEQERPYTFEFCKRYQVKDILKDQTQGLTPLYKDIVKYTKFFVTKVNLYILQHNNLLHITVPQKVFIFFQEIFLILKLKHKMYWHILYYNHQIQVFVQYYQ